MCRHCVPISCAKTCHKQLDRRNKTFFKCPVCEKSFRRNNTWWRSKKSEQKMFHTIHLCESSHVLSKLWAYLYEILVTKLILIWLVICMNLHMAACENKLNILISCHKLCMYIAWILLSISQGLLVTKAVVTNITFPYLYSLKNFTTFSDSLVTICDQKFSVRQSEPPWADSHK